MSVIDPKDWPVIPDDLEELRAIAKYLPECFSYGSGRGEYGRKRSVAETLCYIDPDSARRNINSAFRQFVSEHDPLTQHAAMTIILHRGQNNWRSVVDSAMKRHAKDKAHA